MPPAPDPRAALAAATPPPQAAAAPGDPQLKHPVDRHRRGHRTKWLDQRAACMVFQDVD